ncbi:OmpW/AlkL family protein [Paludibacterium paludis]|uniref:Outer membrane protein n=1 Tax=Paludibacterium paludis TaxID=1225769 RepID=A0A918UAG8_9NEIS|nr:OmpW family outer membrane protein [Paludibacterium paludis]GGY18654.1 outer membrane protein [Paludibacterium paludis]
MKKLVFAVMAGLLSAGAFADQGDILARFRVINVNPDVSKDGALSTLKTDVKDATVPEVDFTYMITNNIGAELILGTSRHEVTVNSGRTSLGKVSVLPPTLTLQYHFNPQGDFRPYVGAGINYTRFYSNDLKVGDQKLDLKNNSYGPALQVGFDYAINKSWYINVDVKKVDIKTDVKLNGTKLGELKINPWIYGIGFGTKF